MKRLHPDWADDTHYRFITSMPLYELIVGYDSEDSFDLAHFLGLKNAMHVVHYRDMMKYEGAVVFITERGRNRKDFGAIEGLFLRGNHRVIDIME